MNVVLFEIGAELRPFQSEISGQIRLAIGQEQGWPAFDRHVAMGDRALERQDRREPVHMRRILLYNGRGLKAEMIVAMRRLRRAAGIDAVDLRRHLVVRKSNIFKWFSEKDYGRRLV